jgi:competence protein ComEA
MDMKLKRLFLSLCLALFLSTGIAFAADKINVNTATQEELQTLNGIGASTAAAIIDYRDQIGEFKSLNSLLEVKGIGEKKLAKLSGQLTVSDSD